MYINKTVSNSMNPLSKTKRGKEAMDPEKIMNGISKEILTALTAMEKAKTPEEKLMCSKTIKNLCDSLGVFLDLISDMALNDDDDSPLPF